jgi:flagellar biosynthesis/type III secretory pathway M-ring protein FliF/YscJ
MSPKPPPEPPAAAKVSETVEDELALPAPTDGSDPAAVGQEAVAALPSPSEKILATARENPAAVANVIRTWVGKEA